MKTNYIIALTAVGAASVLAVSGSIVAYQASVHEQNCLSYERQMNSNFDGLLALANKSLGIVEMVKENPFSAFGLIGEVATVKPQIDAEHKKLNDLKYAYVKVCGQPRFDSTMVPAMAPKLTQFNSIVDKIKSYSF